MSSYFGYTNTRDLQFIFQEWLAMDEVFKLPAFDGMVSTDDVPDFLESMRAFAKEELERVDAAGETFGVKFEDGHVLCCEEFANAFHRLQEDGWGTTNIDPESYQLPRSLLMGVYEIGSAACVPLIGLIILSTCVADLVKRFGSNQVRERFLPKLLEGEWTGALCLTETTCGSDVGALQTRATPTDEPGVFALRGNKQFISYGDHNLADNIVYAVLARPQGAVGGSHGLSLYIVPKYWVDENGNLTENGVAPVGIEDKMGLHGMPTVRMAFGQNGTCRGWLLGADSRENDGRGEGMAQIFQIINIARMSVSMYATAMTGNAVSCAREYAKGRIQGELTGGERGKSVPIIQHEDIRRTLLSGKAHVEAMRAMVYRTMRFFDIAEHGTDAAQVQKANDWVDFCVPLCKSYCSDTAWDVIADQLQVYGGYGYCEDYPLEKIVRDAKVHSLWEGTSYIQARDLVKRKFHLHDGRLLAQFFDEVGDLLAAAGECQALAADARRGTAAYEALSEAVRELMAWPAQRQLLYARRALKAVSQVYAAACLLDQARVAAERLGQGGLPENEQAFYQGKLASAAYFARNVLPEVETFARQVAQPDETALEFDLDQLEY